MFSKSMFLSLEQWHNNTMAILANGCVSPSPYVSSYSYIDSTYYCMTIIILLATAE